MISCDIYSLVDCYWCMRKMIVVTGNLRSQLVYEVAQYDTLSKDSPTIYLIARNNFFIGGS